LTRGLRNRLGSRITPGTMGAGGQRIAISRKAPNRTLLANVVRREPQTPMVVGTNMPVGGHGPPSLGARAGLETGLLLQCGAS